MSGSTAPTVAKPSFWSRSPVRILMVVLTLTITVAIFVFRDRMAKLAAVGYPGIFAVSLLGNATIILPAPFLVLVFAMGSALPWLGVGLASGTGAALGELTGYAAGYGGAPVVQKQQIYARLEGWMRRYGGITILVLSAVPNPFIDVAGVAAGSLGYPLWRFLFFCWLGKTVKTTFVAWAGANAITLIQPYLH